MGIVNLGKKSYICNMESHERIKSFFDGMSHSLRTRINIHIGEIVIEYAKARKSDYLSWCRNHSEYVRLLNASSDKGFRYSEMIMNEHILVEVEICLLFGFSPEESAYAFSEFLLNDNHRKYEEISEMYYDLYRIKKFSL